MQQPDCIGPESYRSSLQKVLLHTVKSSAYLAASRCSTESMDLLAALPPPFRPRVFLSPPLPAAAACTCLRA